MRIIGLLGLFFVVFVGDVLAQVEKSEFLTFAPSAYSKASEIVIEPWNSLEGVKRLERSRYKNDFYELAGFFQAQVNPLYCGMASSVILLNAMRSKEGGILSQQALEISKPSFMKGDSVIPFHSYSQFTFLNEGTDKIKDRDVIRMSNVADGKDGVDPGVTLRQLTDILREVYALNVSIYYVGTVDKKRIIRFRNMVQRIVEDKKFYLLVNFYGKHLGLKTSGHISPVAAYDEESDSVLILDVAGHKNPWYWVKVEHLYKAMNSLDGDMNRGYLIVSDK